MLTFDDFFHGVRATKSFNNNVLDQFQDLRTVLRDKRDREIETWVDERERRWVRDLSFIYISL